MKNRGCFIAMIIVGSSALAMSLSWVFYFLPKWKSIVASNLVFEVERRLEAYHRIYGEWPQGDNTDVLLALRGNNPQKIVFIKENDGFPVKANKLVDQWDTPLRIFYAESGVPKVFSLGPNKKPGDRDDVDSTFARQEAARLMGDKIPLFEPDMGTGPNPAPIAEPIPSPAP